MAFQLFGDKIGNADQAYPYLISQILPPQLRGIMLAALTGAVMSSFNSMLNSASTIFTIDLYARHINRRASQERIVLVGRMATAAFVLVACLWAPTISRFEGVFTYIQKVWGFITPGIVAAFLVGLVVKKAPPLAASGAMLLGVPTYGLLLWLAPQVAFLHHMAMTFLLLTAFMLVVTWSRPLENPVPLPAKGKIETTPLPGLRLWGSVIIAATATLYIIFR